MPQRGDVVQRVSVEDVITGLGVLEYVPHYAKAYDDPAWARRPSKKKKKEKEQQREEEEPATREKTVFPLKSRLQRRAELRRSVMGFADASDARNAAFVAATREQHRSIVEADRTQLAKKMAGSRKVLASLSQAAVPSSHAHPQKRMPAIDPGKMRDFLSSLKGGAAPQLTPLSELFKEPRDAPPVRPRRRRRPPPPPPFKEEQEVVVLPVPVPASDPRPLNDDDSELGAYKFTTAALACSFNHAHKTRDVRLLRHERSAASSAGVDGKRCGRSITRFEKAKVVASYANKPRLLHRPVLITPALIAQLTADFKADEKRSMLS